MRWQCRPSQGFTLGYNLVEIDSKNYGGFTEAI